MLNKPINPSPHNCCVDASESICLKYEIPNNEKVDGRYTYVYDLTTGNVEFDDYSDLSPETNTITSVIGEGGLYNGREYGWQSLYWREPGLMPANKSWTVTGKDNESGALRLLPEGNSKTSVEPEYYEIILDQEPTGKYSWNDYLICDYFHKYDISDFLDNKHTIGDDTSEYCERGILEDYFGYTAFTVGYEFWKQIDDIGKGKCVINIYKDSKLISRAQYLAYDKRPTKINDVVTQCGRYIIIVDNKNFYDELDAGFGDKYVVDDSATAAIWDTTCYPYSKAELYHVDDFNKRETISGMIFETSKNCLIKSYKYLEHEYEIYTNINIAQEFEVGDKIGVWTRDQVEYNESPMYYFRTKNPPSTEIVSPQVLDYVLGDIKCDIYASYSSEHCNLNYFYLYLYVFNFQTYNWELKKKSPMLFDTTKPYEVAGLANGQKYKVAGVFTDKDGDEWETEEFVFVVDAEVKELFAFDPTGNRLPSLTMFNRETTTIDVSIGHILSYYKKASVELYRVQKKDNTAIKEWEYAGGGLAKSNGVVYFDRLYDYNIRNDSYYDYYLRVDYDGTTSPVEKEIDKFGTSVPAGSVIVGWHGLLNGQIVTSETEGLTVNDVAINVEFYDNEWVPDSPIIISPTEVPYTLPDSLHGFPVRYSYHSISIWEPGLGQAENCSANILIPGTMAKGTELWSVASDLHTDFNRTSIMGLEKSSDTQLGIVHNFNLFYHFDNDIGELKNEISREYLGSFSRYPKELKGSQNYISGSFSGLLGSENKGAYEEPRGIRDKWCDFVNDDTIKLYRGIDGETMIISIDTSSIKPHYFSTIGLVNEVKITFKEISSTSQYAIFRTEKTGD